MGLRSSLLKHFGSSSSGSSTDKPKSKSTSKASSDVPVHLHPSVQPHYTARKDITYYKPHEIPKSKYRGRVDPLHSASLAAFSLEGAFNNERRRTSVALSGTFSPGGTQSRSLAPSAAQSRAPSRRPSWSSKPGGEEGHRAREESGSASTSASTVLSGTLSEASTGNTSLSSQPTTQPSTEDETPAMLDADSPTTNKLAQLDSGIALGLTRTATTHDTPFTMEELSQAMTRNTLKQRSLSATAGDAPVPVPMPVS